MTKSKALKGKRVLITGGSRGLGLAMAKVCGREGASLILCARDEAELERSKGFLEGAQVETRVCDVRDRKQIRAMILDIASDERPIDWLINNAGVIDVGPLPAQASGAFEAEIEVNLLGMIRMTLEALQFMRPGARIINITSIGAAVAVPHLLPYSVSKFGALGFSLGLDAELATRGISVTTVLPGLMRTGSFVQALFRGNSRKEFDWFALGAALPVVSISAEGAARKIIQAGKDKRRFLVLGPQAKALRHLYQLFPAASLAVMRLVARMMPRPLGAQNAVPIPGKALRQDLRKNGVTRMGDQAGDRLNENAA